ncbi:MAG TPA: hypothetical protein VMR20_01515 [Verrucomicrobiae bacterium]|jgi:hypothetical protein|nr:hypothetical protein [Verrucomicrobiae bacterium]
MSENDDRKLESMLRRRHVAPASPDLAGRIILKARSLPQTGNISLWQSIRQLFAEFHLPNPGYVLAAALVFGVVVGFSTAPENGQFSDAGVSTAQSYFAGDEGWL